MAQIVKDSFLDLEKHRRLLEANVEKLRKSLEQWQTWEIEYECLKEEVLALGPSPSHQQLLTLGKEFNGQLVTLAEAEDIVGVKIRRTADQVTNVISRRIDYVAQNVKGLKKQIDVAEHKLAAATVISNPEVRNEEGLPLTEIIEELDEEGNVISGRIETQGSTKRQLLEVLEKAGIKDIPVSVQEEGLGYTEAPKKGFRDSEVAEKGITELHENNGMLKASETLKKAVQFAEGTKAGSDAQKQQTQIRIDNTMKLAKYQALPSEVISKDESLENAALRREMLEYSLSEIGPIVAELDLEEENTESYDDDDSYEDRSDMDDEDEFGRSKRAVMTEELRQRMEELEEKLGFSRLGTKAMINLGPNPDGPTDEIRVGKMSKVDDKGQDVPLTSRTEKKGVKFAKDIDISSISEVQVTKSAQSRDNVAIKSPVGDIIERATPKEVSVTQTVPVKIQSQFKKARSTTSIIRSPKPNISIVEAEPSPHSEGKTLADTIIERETGDFPPPEPDELDAALLRQEVTTEYYRIQNRMIQKQGGFLKDPDEETGIIQHTEEDGELKRISRFRAARTARP